MRIVAYSLLITILLITGLAEAQQSGNIPRVIITRPEQTGATTGEALIEAFRQGLRERGYLEGKTIALEILWMAGGADPIPKRLVDTTRPKLDIIITSGTASTRAAQKATRTIPIVMANIGSDPVVEGFVNTFARPAGNITGLTSMSIDLVGKRLEILKEVVPKSSLFAVLLDPSRSRAAELRDLQEAGGALNVKIQPLIVKGPEEFADAFRAAADKRANGVSVVAGGVFNAYRQVLVDVAAKSRLPTIYSEREYVQNGGTMAYSSVLTDQYRRAALFVDKILRGAKPAELPIEQPIKFEFLINLKTAKQIGLTIPPNVLARADRVIK